MIDHIGELRRIMNIAPGGVETYDQATDSLEALSVLLNAFVAIYATLPIFEPITEASVLMTGAEQVLVEKADTKQGFLSGWIDLTPMALGDTIVIRQYVIIVAGGAWVRHAMDTFIGVQANPALFVTTKSAYRGIRVTAQQTGGVNRTLDTVFVRLREV